MDRNHRTSTTRRPWIGLLLLSLAMHAVGKESPDEGGKAMLGVTFTKIANNGTVLPDGAALGSGPSDWACSRHNASGLTFEVKVNSPGTLRHAANTYTWRNTDAGSNGGNAGTAGGGTCAGSTCDTQSYVAAVNAAGLCGSNSWRIPTQTELQRIVGFATPGTGSPVVDAAFFPNLVAGLYWARANVAAIPSHAWAVGLDDGNAGPRAKSRPYRVVLVR
jgi:hypothetical protein